MRSFLRKIFKLALKLAIIGVVAAVGLYFYVFHYIPKQDPDGIFNRENIQELLRGETRVYYNDGETLLGSFFDVNHRLYVPYDSIPIDIINGLVAGEDANFFEHNGFDPMGFARAMFNNLKAGRITGGGSTLTQQTAKNLFGRTQRSYLAKWTELKQALRLEYNFSKQEILEFYLNQFYVFGTGRGVGIAAWYFFSKELRELSLRECAFIAGSVKGPATYDPFSKKSKKARDRALEKGKFRVKYILGRMLKEEYITQEQYDKASKDSLQFKRGDFRFSLSNPLERIEEKLSSPQFEKLLDSLKIESWQDAQLRIISTLDPDIHQANERNLRTALSDLEFTLNGHQEEKSKHSSKVRELPAGEFARAKILRHNTNSPDSLLILSIGNHSARVDKKEMTYFLERSLRPIKGNIRLKGKQLNEEIAKALKGPLKKDNIILVSLRSPLKKLTKKKTSLPLCRIESRPTVEGASLILKNGEVRSSTGGFMNSGYDRAAKALRQFGSSWKPPLYALALLHDWNAMDPLENTNNFFRHGTQAYFPRPDHKKRGSQVSMVWAATRSENIASIWLLVHLLDKLSLEKLEKVAAQNDYLQRKDESTKQYKERLRDSLGLTINQLARKKMRFEKAKQRFRTDLILDGETEKSRYLDWIWYGEGLAKNVIRNARKNKEKARFLTLSYSELTMKLFAYKATHQDIPCAPPSGETDSTESIPAWGMYPNSCVNPLALDTIAGNFTMEDLERFSEVLKNTPYEKEDASLEALSYWEDWRQSLALAEYARFLQEIGIRNPMQQILSMPLGSNDVTLSEMATVYQTLLTGHIFRAKGGEWNQPVWIRTIEDFKGDTLYQAEIESKEILPPRVTQQMALMLASVVQNGTGRAADRYLSLNNPDKSRKGSLKICAMGKTGTTNGFKNSAFLGGIPSWVEGKGMDPSQSVILAAYAGYDNNKPMKSKFRRISGASGALPIWKRSAQSVLNGDSVAHKVDFLDLEYLMNGRIPLYLPAQDGEVSVDNMTGLPYLQGSADSSQKSSGHTAIPLLKF
jgi:membrane peptidoglycan carboxypeptidase